MESANNPPSTANLEQKWNPELRARNEAMREQRQADHELFVSKMKEYSKSSKPIWVVAAEEEKKEKARIAELARQGDIKLAEAKKAEELELERAQDVGGQNVNARGSKRWSIW